MRAAAGAPGDGNNEAHPKDRIAIASQMAQVTSGEVTGDEMVRTLQSILRADAQNPQAHLRLGYAEIDRGRCDRAEPHLRFALQAQVPSADAGLGLAGCLLRRGDREGAATALAAARRAEPGNPVVAANIGLLALQNGDFAIAITSCRQRCAPTRFCWKRGSRWRAPWPVVATGQARSSRPRSCWRNSLRTLPNAAKSSG